MENAPQCLDQVGRVSPLTAAHFRRQGAWDASPHARRSSVLRSLPSGFRHAGIVPWK
ncbi:MAG TPA: hypothetical protein VK811_10315 [Candidatus Acidoferrum sp.]|nr:hypothetical protein [Candidatus Acidoferrum sp.]